MPTKQELLKDPVQHIDITAHNVVPLVDAMASMAYSSRDLARAATIYDTFIDEEELRICDDTTKKIIDGMKPAAYSSREYIKEMGKYLKDNGRTPQNGNPDSIVLAAYELDVPIFCPAFSDCSFGFGIVAHQHERQGKPMCSIDSGKDFYEITQLKIQNPSTGLLMIGGGVPKNFAQDIVVAADILGVEASMHKYAIQITVADARDGALSGSTLKEASSWGKVDLTWEQMVYSEATIAFPLIAAYALHKNAAAARTGKHFAQLLEPVTA